MPRKRVAVLISGRGSNMLALIDAAAPEDYPAEVALVVSNKATAAGLEIARSRHIAADVVDHSRFPSRDAFEQALDSRLRAANIDIVCLAGFMRVLSASFVKNWKGRVLNIHPSLLPEFKGLDTHARALQAGVARHGCSVHFVVPELDAGPVIMQAEVPVLAGDDEASLAARVLAEEHRIYPEALRRVALGQVRLEGERAVASVN